MHIDQIYSGKKKNITSELIDILERKWSLVLDHIFSFFLIILEFLLNHIQII